MKNTHRHEQGFTLIEVAVVILVAGLIIGGLAAILKPYLLQQKIDVTNRNMQIVSRALDEFAQRYYRLPCPAPAHTQGAFQQGVAWDACISPAIWPIYMPATTNFSRGMDGVVPYRTLGLTREQATDGFDNPITYDVSSSGFLANPLLSGGTFAACRTSSWFKGALAINPRKAAFCCTTARYAPTDINGIGGLIVLRDPANDPNLRVIPTQDSPDTVAPALPAPGTATGSWDLPNVPYTTPGPFSGLSGTIMDVNLEYIAYALISHGPNGEMSYVWGQQNRKTRINAGTYEIENADNDNLPVAPRNRVIVDWQQEMPAPNGGTALRPVRNDLPGDPNNYDDIVLWKTQDQVMSAGGHTSCAMP